MRLAKFAVAALLLSTSVYATVSPVPVSLRSTVSQEIGKTNVSIEYSRPNAKGREVFGELTPYGEVWRTGANVSTALEFDTTVSINGTEVPAGRYSLFTIPNKDKWTVIINKVPDEFGAFSYDVADDLFRFEVSPKTIPTHVETFTINFANVADNKANIQLSWQNTAVSFPITVTEESNNQQILSEIQRDIIEGKERTWGNYGDAARFYAKNGMDPKTASEWFGKCTELNPDAYWMHHEHASFLAAQGHKKEALGVANKGLESAKRQNDKNGEDWLKGLISELGRK